MITRRTWPAAVVTAVLLLSGCSAADPSIDDATAQTLDDAVVAVAERASADDFAGALTELEALQAALAAALTSGSVTQERAASIQAEVDVVRGDLEAATAAGEAPEPAPVETEEAPDPEEPVEETPVEEEPVEEVPVEEAPVEETPAPVETEEEAPSPSPEETAPVEEEAPEPEESEPAEEAPANGNNGNGNSGNGNSGNGNSGTGNDGNNGNGNGGNGNGSGNG
ncbi:hypothetical protein ASF48_03255 [Rathayibacter sp. Leaf299]|uniref:hypothetical protein n=1 Tax=Rathayibacter sp. Leaf299 TaxID=1736328 RepID=UPI0006FB2298|nr:hypothetical protein [Rathayibacter sp. Leaf299]KQQ22241.1 hypothetical protein ASF48_03255 [Rathayibacter sp. Leaf299]